MACILQNQSDGSNGNMLLEIQAHVGADVSDEMSGNQPTDVGDGRQAHRS